MCSIALSCVSIDTFPRYQYTRDRVETLIARFKRFGFETSVLPRFEDISILEAKSSSSLSPFLINHWIDSEREVSDRTSIKQDCKSKPVVAIVYDNGDIPDECVYGIILETDQQTKAYTKQPNIISSSIKDLKGNVDRLLERYILSFLQTSVNNGSPRTTWEPAVFIEQRENSVSKDRLYGRLLSDVMAVFKRSSAPPDEWPTLKMKETLVLNENVSQEMSQLDSSLIGVGFEHDILQLFVDRNENTQTDTALEELLAKHKIAKHHINYGPWKCDLLCDIRVGQQLKATQRRGTLGGFATKDGNLYALTARHVVEGAKFLFIERSEAHGTDDEFAIVERGDVELDIAAVRIERPDQISNPMFMSSRRACKKSILFNFRGKDDNEIQKLLEGEQVYAWTSAKVPLKGRICIPIYVCLRSNQRYVALENEFDVDDSESDALPNPYAFGKEGDSGAIICSDDIDGDGVIVYSMFTNKLENRNGRRLFLTLRLQDGLDQLSNNQVPVTESCFALC